MSVPSESAAEPAAETGRLEAFSDGVFAVAITLLVFDLHAYSSDELRNLHKDLLRALLDQWPHYLAYVLSFLTILIMWVNHHTIFKCVKRTDHTFLLLNGTLLLFVTAIPFPTQLMAEHIQQSDAKVAEVVYSGTFLAAACIYNILWRYAAYRDRLIGSSVDRRLVQAINDAFRFGPALYLLAFVVAFVNAALSLTICIALAVFYAIPNHAHRAPRG